MALQQVHLTSSRPNETYFQIWTDDEAGRGCDEVGSAIIAFLLKAMQCFVVIKFGGLELKL